MSYNYNGTEQENENPNLSKQWLEQEQQKDMFSVVNQSNEQPELVATFHPIEHSESHNRTGSFRSV